MRARFLDRPAPSVSAFGALNEAFTLAAAAHIAISVAKRMCRRCRIDEI